MRAFVRSSAFTLVLLAHSLSFAEEAGAEPTPAQVRVAAEAFDRGRESYKQEEFIDAAEQFERADSNAPSSAALELAIRARDKAGELDRAATLAALALQRHPNDANLQKIVPELLKRARDELFELETTCDAPCDLTAGGKIVHGAPTTTRTLFVRPGKFTVRAGWPDERSDSKQIEATAGGQGTFAFVAPAAKLPVSPAAAANSGDAEAASMGAETAAPRSGLPPVVFWSGVGATALAGAITIWSGIDTQNNPGADEVRRRCAGLGEECDAYQEGRDKQFRTNVLVGVTVGLGAATILVGVLATDWRGRPSTARAPSPERKALARGSWLSNVRVAPWAAVSAGGVAASGRF